MVFLAAIKRWLPLILRATIATPLNLPSTAQRAAEYDYVVVGSGAGGGTVAASLARKGHSVFLMEAGGDRGENPLQVTPVMNNLAAENPEMSWRFWIRHYRNETQGRRDSKFTYRLPSGDLYFGLDPPEGAEPLGTLYPRGSTLGGSTQVSAMNWAIPSDTDWDDIAQLTGDPTWSADSMNPYFIELENALYLPEGTPDHGYDGFISSNRNNISYVTSRPGVVEIMSALSEETEGVQVTNPEHLAQLMQRDINSPEYSFTPGVYQVVVSVNQTRRRSGVRNYVVGTVEAGFPLTVSTHSLATRILFENGGEMPKAYGVEYIVGEGLYGADRRYGPSKEEQLFNVTAKKEVIVAGGAFNTPQILKLSGVGPREELDNLDIPVVVDLPGVGKNLQDHTEGIMLVNASTPWLNNPTATCTFDYDDNDPCYQEWLNNGTGPYGEAAAPIYWRLRSRQADSDYADVCTFGFTGTEFRGYYPGYSQAAPQPHLFARSMVVQHAPGDRSETGNVTLRSTDPRDPPVIVFDWLQGERGQRNLEALAEGFEVAYRVFDEVPAPFGPFRRVQPPEGADIVQNIMDEAFGHHASSSCRIGAADDADACVDPELRVRGVRGLRVVDASIFPHTPSAFPTAPITMMALKAADVISNSTRFAI